MFKRFFITGTDTSVGKTVVSRALLQALAARGKSVAGYKPVAKGSKETPDGLRNKDALVLQSVSTLALPYEAVNPIALSEDESSVAHSCPINYGLLSDGLQRLAAQVEHVVVEGTGGWRSLMNDLRPLSEWVVQEQLPVLMVVGIQEGCINHALLTAQAIANDGLPLIGWVANRINPGLAHYAEIIDVLSKKLPAPLIGELPYLPRAEQRELSRYVDLDMLGNVMAIDRIPAYVRDSTDDTTQVISRPGSSVYCPVISQIIRVDMIGAWVVAARNAAMPVRPIMMAISSLPGSHSLLKQANSMPIARPTNSVGVKTPPGAPEPLLASTASSLQINMPTSSAPDGGSSK